MRLIDDQKIQTAFRAIDKGAGLGMNISYEIVKGAKGEMLLESAEGEVCAFVVALPLGPGEE